MTDVPADSSSTPAPKKTLLGRLLGWAIPVALMCIAGWYIAGLRAEQKNNFRSEALAKAEAQCKGDASCLPTARARLSVCLELHSSSHKSGKVGRKYSLDEPAFLTCMRG